jgi:small ligand-binding sensory domain FIST
MLLQAVVAQGCRPVGRSFQVTVCDQNIIIELNYKPPCLATSTVAARPGE